MCVGGGGGGGGVGLYSAATSMTGLHKNGCAQGRLGMAPAVIVH